MSVHSKRMVVLALALIVIFLSGRGAFSQTSLKNCSPAELKATTHGMDGGAGNAAWALEVTNVAKVGCRLQGVPKVEFLSGARKIQDFSICSNCSDYLFQSIPAKPYLTLHPASSAFFLVGGAGAEYGSCGLDVSIAVIFPDRKSLVFRYARSPKFGFAICKEANVSAWHMGKYSDSLCFTCLGPGGAAPDAGSTPEAHVSLSSAFLAFSKDGRVLHVIGESPGDLAKDQHVSAITYDAATGAVVHVVNLQPGTKALSVTSNGGKAIVAVGGFDVGEQIRLLLLDTETGKREAVPSTWYDPKDTEPDVELSGDGRFVSIYGGPGETDDRPMVVSVYLWSSKTLVGRQTSQYIDAGGSFGGRVTVEGGAIELMNNRSGSELVDLKTGREMARFGADSVRSPDGRWVVELPDQSFKPESAPRDVLIKDGASGQIRGKIDVQVPDDEAYGQMTGAFCGTTSRFVLASGHYVAAYAIPSGTLLESFPAETWRDPAALDPSRASVACSATAARVAILSGTRLTLHDMKREQ